MEYSEVLNDEKMSAIKAQRGIENIEELYRQVQENEEQGEDEGDGEENNGNENGKENGNENENGQ
jgi:hypothetical protein